MDDSLSIVFATLIAIILMFLFPMVDTWELQDNLSYATTYATVVDFVDTVRNVGEISPNAYYSFETKLGMTGNTFTVTMEHRKFLEDVGGYMNAYTSDIISELRSGSTYKLDKYDYFYVTVKNTNITQSTVIKNFVYAGGLEPFKIGTSYGGIVWAVQD